jgi:transposase
MTPGQPTMPRKEPMKTYSQLSHFGGLDWAKHHHDVCILEPQGQIVERLRFEHSGPGWEKFREQIRKYPALGIAIETSQGAVVEQLLGSGVTVYPVHPKAAKAYRQRQAPSGTKDDELDSWSLGDALRMDGRGWRALSPQDPMIAELRLLCRDEEELIGQRTALVNQLQAALGEYYPAALEAFADWTVPYTWEFIARFPTPQQLAGATVHRQRVFLHTHKLWRPGTADKRLEIFARADQFCGGAAVTRAKSRLALALVKLLQAVQKQLDEYRVAIERLFAEHPDHDVFGSLPGVGQKLGPRLLGSLGADRGQYPDVQGLQCVAGSAPVSFKSGQMRRVKIRWHCDRFLRHTVHLWANCSLKTCAWAAAYYKAKREAGQSHACALRCLAQRWLKILWKMWQTHTLYDPEYHARNQQRHGSWVLQLNPKKA